MKEGYDSDDIAALLVTGEFNMFEINFWLPYPRRKSTPVIQGNKKLIEKIIREAIKAKETTWLQLKISVENYAQSDKVREGFVQMPLTFVRAQGWNYEYEVPRTPEEILAAKPLAERTLDDWREILGQPTEFIKHWLKQHPEKLVGAPDLILEEYGLRKDYG